MNTQKLLHTKEMKKVFLYCHDTLAFGHISRMLNIYHVLSQDHDVYMIFWGKVPEKHVRDKNYISLPILQEKDIFENPKISSKILQDRKKILQRSIGVHKPDTLLIDYFPFGRIALKDEIEEIIKYIKEYKQEAKIYTFMRDIFHASSTLDRQE